MSDQKAQELIDLERLRQDLKWGKQYHEPEVWLAILTEEVGELAEAILHARFGNKHGSHSEDMLTEATQVAAVAQAFMADMIERKAES